MKANCIEILEELGRTLMEHDKLNADVASIIVSNFLTAESAENCVDLAAKEVRELAEKIADSKKNKLA